MVTAGKLTYYKEQNLKERKGEVAMTSKSEIESIANHTKSFRKLKSVFRVTNDPFLEIEMSAADEKVMAILHNSWQRCNIFGHPSVISPLVMLRDLYRILCDFTQFITESSENPVNSTEIL